MLRNKRFWLIVLFIGLLVVFLYTTVVKRGSLPGQGKPEQTSTALAAGQTAAQDFLSAIKAEDFDAAYARLGSALQGEVGSAQGLQERIKQGEVTGIASWAIEEMREDGTRQIAAGKISLSAGDVVLFHLILENEGGAWKVAGFDFEVGT